MLVRIHESKRHRVGIPHEILRAHFDRSEVGEVEFQEHGFLSSLLFQLLDDSAGLLLIPSAHVYFRVVPQQNLGGDIDVVS